MFISSMQLPLSVNVSQKVDYQIFTVAIIWIRRRFVFLFIRFTETRLQWHHVKTLPHTVITVVYILHVSLSDTMRQSTLPRTACVSLNTPSLQLFKQQTSTYRFKTTITRLLFNWPIFLREHRLSHMPKDCLRKSLGNTAMGFILHYEYPSWCQKTVNRLKLVF